MSERDRNPAGGSRQTQGGPAAPSGKPQAARIVLIESRKWLRECLAYALVSFLPDVAVEGATSVDEVVPGPARLVLIGLDPRSGCEPAQLRGAFETLRRVAAGSPIGAYLHADNAAVAKLVTTLGVAGIVMPSASVEIAVASVRLMAAGGSFLPAELFDRQEEANGRALAAQRPPQDAVPPAAARPNELPAPLEKSHRARTRCSQQLARRSRKQEHRLRSANVRKHGQGASAQHHEKTARGEPHPGRHARWRVEARYSAVIARRTIKAAGMKKRRVRSFEPKRPAFA